MSCDCGVCKLSLFFQWNISKARQSPIQMERDKKSKLLSLLLEPGKNNMFFSTSVVGFLSVFSPTGSGRSRGTQWDQPRVFRWQGQSFTSDVGLARCEPRWLVWVWLAGRTADREKSERRERWEPSFGATARYLSADCICRCQREQSPCDSVIYWSKPRCVGVCVCASANSIRTRTADGQV